MPSDEKSRAFLALPTGDGALSAPADPAPIPRISTIVVAHTAASASRRRRPFMLAPLPFRLGPGHPNASVGAVSISEPAARDRGRTRPDAGTCQYAVGL